MRRRNNRNSRLGAVLYTAILLFFSILFIPAIFCCANPENSNDANTSAQNMTAIDKSKIQNYSRKELSQGLTVHIPPNEKRIIPLEIKPGEKMESFSYSSTLAGDLYAFFTDSEGNIILEHPLAHWQPGTYYLHIVNERESDISRKVELNIRFNE